MQLERPSLRDFDARTRLRAAFSAMLRIFLFGALFAVFTAAGAVLFASAAPVLREFTGAASMLVAALAAGALLLRFLDQRSSADLGFAWTPRTPRELWAGMLIGGAALVIGVALLATVGRVTFVQEPGSAPSFLYSVSSALLLLGIAAAAEEALFRGYPFQVLVRGIGMWPATLLASAGFAYAHRHNPGVGAIALANIFLAGVLLSLAYLRTGSLWFATAVHLGWNWTMASLLDLPVSGLNLFDTPYYDSVLNEPSWLTGGGFGPEAGVIATLAFIAMLAAVMKYPRDGASDG